MILEGDKNITKKGYSMPVFLNDTLVFAGRLLDRKELEQSSSGGAFTALSNWAFENNDAIVITAEV